MAGQLVECVPNISEGRDESAVAAAAEAVAGVRGVALLDRSMDPDHNRSVLTFAGSPEAVVEAAVRLVRCAAERIDLTKHDGVHPRIGAADVVPFVPVRGLTLEDCARLARAAGGEIWRRCRVPVYLYGAAASHPVRAVLSWLRRGGFEMLRQEAVRDPERAPDIGGPALHPTAGACAVGARKFLIAYNINLAGEDIHLARRIARRIRGSSGGFPHVQALGVYLPSRRQAQVTMNLVDFAHIPVEQVYQTVSEEASRGGTAIAGCEIIGLIPRKAFEMAPAFYMRAANFRPDIVLETRLAALESK